MGHTENSKMISINITHSQWMLLVGLTNLYIQTYETCTNWSSGDPPDVVATYVSRNSLEGRIRSKSGSVMIMLCIEIDARMVFHTPVAVWKLTDHKRVLLSYCPNFLVHS